MIYVWGLVASGQSTGIESNLQHRDWGMFWPGYGALCPRLMATNGTLLLLMYTTC